MLAKLRTFSLVGIDALPVEVEVDVSPGALPKTVLVGLPEAAVKESTHRVERAMVNSGFLRPDDRIVINLAPAELPKQAASFDLPITLGMLAGSGQIASELFDDYAVVGELALDGTHAADARRAVDGHAAAAKQRACGAGRAHAPARPRRPSSKGIEVIAVSQPGAGRGVFHRRDRDRSHAAAAGRMVRRVLGTTTSTSPTSAARRWPSGRSRSPPPAATIS